MFIAFDSSPLISEKLTGIGYCESGQVKSLIKSYPHDKFEFQFFSMRNTDVKELRLLPYKSQNAKSQSASFPPALYRTLINFIPLSYSSFFGKKADVTHFFNYIVPPSVKTAVVATVHDMVYKAYPETMNKRTRKMFDLSLRKSMKRSDIIVTDSEFSKSEIIKYYPQFEEKIRVVPCGVDLNKFTPEIESAEIARIKINFSIHGDYFLYLGTLEPRKNLVRLIEGYAKFREKSLAEDKDKKLPYLVLAGAKGWQFDEIFEKVTNLGLESSVIFTSYIPDEDLSPLIHGAIAFVFPSIYEGFGLPPLEAMACGTPVVVSNAASLPEVVGDCGVIVDAFDTDSIAKGLEDIFTDEFLRRKLSEKGIRRAKDFTWKRSAEILHDVYEEAIEIHKSKKEN